MTKILEKVNVEDKQWRPLQKMFNDIPRRYDLMNRLLTLGFDECWRKMTARECLEGNPARILDLCTGTGDLAINIARLANSSTEILGLDYSEGMLSIARKKAMKNGYGRINFINGDAASMPFDNGAINAIGIAFAFRNLTYKNPDCEKFLKEIYRVLAPGGRFVIVETSQPVSTIITSFFYTYLKIFVAGIGGWISGHKSAYKYLATSARNFYSSDEVIDMMSKTGFSKNQFKRLLGGIAGITIGIK